MHRGVLYGALPDSSGLCCPERWRVGGIDHWSAAGRFFFDSKGQVDNLAGVSDFNYLVTGVVAEEFARPSAESAYVQATMQGGLHRFFLATGQDDGQLVSGSGAADLTVSPDGSVLAYFSFDTSDQTQKIWTVSSAG